MSVLLVKNIQVSCQLLEHTAFQIIDFQHFYLLVFVKAVLIVEKPVKTCHKAQHVVFAEEFPVSPGLPAGALGVGS